MERNGRVPFTRHKPCGKQGSQLTYSPAYLIFILFVDSYSELPIKKEACAPLLVSSIIILFMLQSQCNTPLSSTAICWTIDAK